MMNSGDITVENFPWNMDGIHRIFSEDHSTSSERNRISSSKPTDRKSPVVVVVVHGYPIFRMGYQWE